MLRSRFALFSLLAGWVLVPASIGAAEPLIVFGAASLTDALEEIGRDYGRATGVDVRFSFAASSTRAAQIEAGAPAQIFASANLDWMDHLAERGLIVAGTRIEPIANQLVLIAPAGSRLAAEAPGTADLLKLLGPQSYLAVGDPDHVPAGMYARQALRSLGQWQAVESRLARANDVRGAVALVERGEVPLGIVYATDARVSTRVRIVGRFPAGSHDPIRYAFAIVEGRDSEAVRTLFEYLTGPEGLGVFERYGFVTD